MSAQAEQAILGQLLLGAQSKVLDVLGSEDFEDGRHRLIASAIRQLSAWGRQVDPVTVGRELDSRAELRAAGGASYLAFLTSVAPVGAALGFWAAEVRDAARLRAAVAASSSFTEALGREGASEHLPALIQNVTERLSALPPDLESQDETPAPTVHDLLMQEDEADDWLIPGWLTRGERVVLTGGEGVAKSTILKQIGCCLAAGLNPWNGDRVSDGLRVLHIDAENSERQNRRNYRWIGNRMAPRMPAPGWAGRIVHYVRNDGVDIVGRDRAWFLAVCEKARPDVIIIGPAYKLMHGDPNKDVDVLALLSVLDHVRVKYDAALLIEAHSGHTKDGEVRSVRPVGSSVWLRWPEVGIGVRRDMSDQVEQMPRPENLEIAAWRGAREPRDWPDLIQFGAKSEMPWAPTRPDWRPSVESNYTINPELERP